MSRRNARTKTTSISTISPSSSHFPAADENDGPGEDQNAPQRQGVDGKSEGYPGTADARAEAEALRFPTGVPGNPVRTGGLEFIELLPRVAVLLLIGHVLIIPRTGSSRR